MLELWRFVRKELQSTEKVKAMLQRAIVQMRVLYQVCTERQRDMHTGGKTESARASERACACASENSHTRARERERERGREEERDPP